MNIYFDMDGTIVDLYGFPNWLEELRKFSATPYSSARPMCDLARLCRILNRLQRAGHKLYIVSWSSKVSNEIYDTMVEEAKRYWLYKHMPSIRWNEVFITQYGVNKASTAQVKDEQDILFDDDERNLNDWRRSGGTAHTPDEIFEVLKGILHTKN